MYIFCKWIKKSISCKTEILWGIDFCQQQILSPHHRAHRVAVGGSPTRILYFPFKIIDRHKPPSPCCCCHRFTIKTKAVKTLQGPKDTRMKYCNCTLIPLFVYFSLKKTKKILTINGKYFYTQMATNPATLVTLLTKIGMVTVTRESNNLIPI